MTRTHCQPTVDIFTIRWLLDAICNQWQKFQPQRSIFQARIICRSQFGAKIFVLAIDNNFSFVDGTTVKSTQRISFESQSDWHFSSCISQKRNSHDFNGILTFLRGFIRRDSSFLLHRTFPNLQYKFTVTIALFDTRRIVIVHRKAFARNVTNYREVNTLYVQLFF